jgi:hypothetical protein
LALPLGKAATPSLDQKLRGEFDRAAASKKGRIEGRKRFLLGQDLT